MSAALVCVVTGVGKAEGEDREVRRDGSRRMKKKSVNVVGMEERGRERCVCRKSPSWSSARLEKQGPEYLPAIKSMGPRFLCLLHQLPAVNKLAGQRKDLASNKRTFCA